MRVLSSAICLIVILGFSNSSVLKSDQENDDAPTNDETIECYQCHSISGECSEEQAGATTDCPALQGCNINLVKNSFTRGCSVNTESGCTEEADTRNCDCMTPLCNKDWKSAGAEEKILCYSCDSNVGECDATHAGTEIFCEKEAGCVINTDLNDGNTVFMRGCSGSLGESGCNNEDNATTCICHGALCNFNWEQAGSTAAGTDAPTEPSDETIQCYSCDSNDGECSEEQAGTMTNCPVEQGCNINLNKDLFTRGCSVNNEPGCTEEADTRNCDCMTPLCNKDWKSSGAEDKILCYSCDSNVGECDATHPGSEISCEKEAGCVINTDVHDGNTVFMRGCSGSLGESGCNNEDNATTCICHEALCNFNWEQAGSTTGSSETTPKGPTLMCYKCDSTVGDCTEQAHGEEVECAKSEGCTIRKTSGTDGEVMIRDCSTEKDALCDTIDDGEGGETTQFCNCNTALCNADWSQAGSTTAVPGSATNISSAFAVALGVVGAVVVLLR